MKRPVRNFFLGSLGLGLAVLAADWLFLPPVVQGEITLGGDDLPPWKGTPTSCSYRGMQMGTEVGPDDALWLIADAANIDLRKVSDGTVVWKGSPTCVHANMTSDPDSDHGRGTIEYACPGDPVVIDLKLERCDRRYLAF